MGIESINSGLSITPKLIDQVEKKNNNVKGEDFQNVLTNFVDKVEASSSKADQITKDFIMGDDVQVHEVMIAAEQAKTDVMLLSEIRNKALDTYKELLRMQI